MHTFAILHISDTHVRQGLHAGRHYIVERLASWTHDFSRSNHIDAMILTGDLADDGTAASVDEVRALITPPPRGSPDPYLHPDGRPTLASTGVPLMAMPGNHDRYTRRFIPLWQDSGAGNTTCDPFMSWDSGLGGVRRFDLPPAPGVTDTLAIVAADLCIQTPGDAGDGAWAVAGRGKAGPSVIRDLVVETQKATDQRCAVMWALHFPPGFYDRYPGTGIERVFFSPYLQLIYGQRVLGAATSNGISQIVAGHSHKRRHYVPVSGQRVFIHCAGTAGKAGKSSDVSAHVYHVDVDGGRIVDFRVQDYVLHPPYRESFVASDPIVNGYV